MKLQKIKIANKGLLEVSSMKYADLYFGNVYLMFTAELGIQEQLFSEYKDQVSFINSPFEGAITIAEYYRLDSDILLKYTELINSMVTYPPVDGSEYLDKILVIVLSQLAEKNLIVIETTGMGENSIIRLTNYSLYLLQRFKDKMIIIIDFYYSKSNKVFIELATNELTNKVSEYLPVDLIRSPEKASFKLRV
jgi:hypothetical protein